MFVAIYAHRNKPTPERYMTKAAEAFEFINNAIASGKTVYISTCTRSTVITPKTAAKWSKSGHDLFKLADNALFMASGNKFVRIAENNTCLVKIQAA